MSDNGSFPRWMNRHTVRSATLYSNIDTATSKMKLFPRALSIPGSLAAVKATPRQPRHHQTTSVEVQHELWKPSLANNKLCIPEASMSSNSFLSGGATFNQHIIPAGSPSRGVANIWQQDYVFSGNERRLLLSEWRNQSHFHSVGSQASTAPSFSVSHISYRMDLPSGP